MVLETAIEELDLSMRLFHRLRRAGLETVNDIVSLTWQDLKQRARLTPLLMEEIISRLDQAGFRLLNCPVERYATADECVKEIKRQIRLSNSNTLRLEFLPPDPESYTKGGKGYTIYFNIHSLLTKPIKLSICDSGVFANKRQWNRDYNYTGHTLSNEYVFPTIPRTVGQIFLTENASYEELEKGDFYTVSFECEKNNTLYFYKYVYLGNGQWEFYDYYEVEK